MRPLRRALRGDDGSAAVDFALVGALVTVLFVAVVQLALVLHVRNTLVDCAAEGARYAALDGHEAADGVARTRSLVEQSLAPSYAQDVRAVRTTLGGVDVIEVTVRAPLPVVGLIGPRDALTVRGHAFAEDQ
ncbi:TadE family protein [Cellulomonas fimi]|uniref:TadE family protein n=1 Tax=Cellulomonas fimi (strain ATCC 484 / DSM 20113 / JCM 1341 / CCUG 24087 / LMG 16345 / NBRC 15513 / NCIMB 8980 / NCTC 7547 / NRS-133) TaxID=590998 RepID=F4H613_CELFA|nr:TadE/TadG family type IV pilus assembly protein [Cellulomonas fimi]AEE46743.1 TadE family protein [Cellulomonas fimi ATCC 484]NNH07612.1 pilus assembly protein [Cellulomonas fimi]VEH34054.1 TadE-like protein [Cellulomonas fimi]